MSWAIIRRANEVFTNSFGLFLCGIFELMFFSVFFDSDPCKNLAKCRSHGWFWLGAV